MGLGAEWPVRVKLKRFPGMEPTKAAEDYFLLLRIIGQLRQHDDDYALFHRRSELLSVL